MAFVESLSTYKEPRALTVYNNPKTELKEVYGHIKSRNVSFLGFFYLLEYGGNLKIGQTKSPYERYTTLNRTATKYSDITLGRMAVSLQHTNYIDNEKYLHSLFSNYREEGTELFHISLEDALYNIENTDIILENKSKLLEEKSEATVNFLKNFIFSLPT